MMPSAPPALFCGGHNYFVSRFAQRHGWEPYSIHTTYQYAAAAGKRHRLREHVGQAVTDLGELITDSGVPFVYDEFRLGCF